MSQSRKTLRLYDAWILRTRYGYVARTRNGNLGVACSSGGCCHPLTPTEAKKLFLRLSQDYRFKRNIVKPTPPTTQAGR